MPSVNLSYFLPPATAQFSKRKPSPNSIFLSHYSPNSHTKLSRETERTPQLHSSEALTNMAMALALSFSFLGICHCLVASLLRAAGFMPRRRRCRCWTVLFSSLTSPQSCSSSTLGMSRWRWRCSFGSSRLNTARRQSQSCCGSTEGLAVPRLGSGKRRRLGRLL